LEEAMKKIGLIIFIVAVAVGVVFSSLFSFGRFSVKSPVSLVLGSKIKGSGNVVTEKREISNFKAIDVSGVFNIVVVAQKDFSVEVEADDNLLPFIKTEVSGETLEIQRDKRFSTKNSITIRISAPNIEEIENSGVSKIHLSNVANEFLEIDSSGASSVKVEGTSKRLSLELSGASRIDASGLTAEKVSVDGSGASLASVNVL
jgi:predicted DNA binding CopG/RHH family protein